MTAELYHADPCVEPSLSASVAKILLDETPAHARLAHPKLNPQHEEDDDPKFDAGKVLHSLFLEGDDRMAVCTALSPSTGTAVVAWQTKEAKQFREEARGRGLVPVLAHQHNALRRGLATLRKRTYELDDKPAPFTAGKPEQTLVWQEDNGIWCRARLDWLHDDYTVIDDLKIVASANPGSAPGQFGRNVENLGHYIQEAFYRRGLKTLTGSDATFRFIGFELDGPGIACTSLSAAYRAIGESAVSRAIALWGDCLSRNDWPGYPRWRVEIEPPAWMVAQAETLLAEEDLF
jgi:hypothetical protein